MNKKISDFLCDSKNKTKDSYLWNMLASFLFGFQSVILLIVLTRTVEIEQAGVFTIAYSSASLLLFIGKYGVRNYQVSDVKDEHTFGDYVRARMISVSAMLMVTFGYVILSTYMNHYSREKSIVIFLTCLYKVPDAVEDVFFGEYQRKGRLDIAAKIMALRLFLSILTLSVFVFIFKDLILSLVLSIVVAFICVFYFVYLSIGKFKVDMRFSFNSIGRIFGDCFPLFMGSFLSQYISNAPKYAIDVQLSDIHQACYGFIAMPVFVIGLMNNIIYAPSVHRMAMYWDSNKINSFIKRFLIQVGIVLLITICCLIGAYLVGIPVLSLMYSTDLTDYKTELLILLMGGGFLALSGLLNTTLTVMRYQYPLLIGYVFTAFCALFFSDTVVINFGMSGAAWLYTTLMGILALGFVCIFVIALIKKQINRTN